MTIDPLMNGRIVYESNSNVAKTNELTRRSKGDEAGELQKVCEEFENLFIKMMLDSMRDTLNDDTLIPKNAGEKLFENQLYDEYAAKIGRTANLGIAEMMYNQLEPGLPGDMLNI